MNSVQGVSGEAFGNLLQTKFVSGSIPNQSNINPKVEIIKGKAADLALAIFNPGKSDLYLSDELTFGKYFSQEIYGAGFTKGLAGIWAYLICLEEESNSCDDENVRKFSLEVNKASNDIFERLSKSDRQLSDVRKKSEQLDNYGGYYDITKLSDNHLHDIALEGSLIYPLEIDPYSGHLVAKLPKELAQQLLEAYRSEIETHLTEQGSKNLGLPNNIGFVVVAYKDELTNTPQNVLDSILKNKVTVSFKQPYIVPVRGDNRYSLVASILVEAPEISIIRKELGLGELYSPGRPLRYTFGAVHNIPAEYDNETLIKKLRTSNALKPWMNFIDEHVTNKI